MLFSHRSQVIIQNDVKSLLQHFLKDYFEADVDRHKCLHLTSLRCYFACHGVSNMISQEFSQDIISYMLIVRNVKGHVRINHIMVHTVFQALINSNVPSSLSDNLKNTSRSLTTFFSLSHSPARINKNGNSSTWNNKSFDRILSGNSVVNNLLGPIVQSIVSLTSLLRGQLVECYTTFSPNTLIFFVEKK